MGQIRSMAEAYHHLSIRRVAKSALSQLTGAEKVWPVFWIRVRRRLCLWVYANHNTSRQSETKSR